LSRSLQVGFGLALAVGSAATVDKYLGLAATCAYVLVLAGSMPWLLGLLSRARRRLTDRWAVELALATLLALAALFAALYPEANSQALGSGSDRDDAADIGARALLDGDYPYGGRTYLGNPISQLPGGLVFATPFVAVGRSAYAAFFWLPLFFVLLRELAGESRAALLLAWTALALSPVVVREIVTGGDLLANTVAVMLAAWLVVRGLERAQVIAWMAAVGLGLALSWRLNFVFVVPPLLALVWRRHGPRGTAAIAAIVGGAFAAVTLPFYLGHADQFTPIAASDKLEGFDGAIPGGARAVILAGVCLSVALAVTFGGRTIGSVFAQTAVVQAFFVLAVVVLASAQAATLELEPLVPGYGLPVVLLALAWCCGAWTAAGRRDIVGP
jgi:hypothetical protein